MRLQWKSRNLFSLSALVIVNAILAVFTVTSVFYFRQSSFCLTPGCAGGFEIMTGRIRRANANTVQEASTEKSPSSKVKPKKVGSPQVSYEEELNRKTRELFGGVTYRDKRLDLISYRIVPRREFCSNISYVVVIPTMPEDDTVRYQLRSTYGSTKMRTKYRYHVVFVMGRARTPDSQRFLDYESKRHGDILQADFMESYRNLTVKTLAAFRFATAACPGIKAIAKIDVDAGWSVAQMSEIVESLRDDKLYCGEYVNQFL
ncbi:unnamed protein product [Heligmosomoides polygyrus]|uniref:Hexosyltransferase n=1 Tax=Heligmosomoides polygyrus TaxID=6339 RepID=A0A3P8CDR2_HELPZ|nr:unnamed protein product [Heligmosomoides polygyrus]